MKITRQKKNNWFQGRKTNKYRIFKAKTNEYQNFKGKDK